MFLSSLDIVCLCPGENYYLYDDVNDRVAPGYPWKIATDFAASEGTNDSIPDNIDSVVFDQRDSLLHFFKGEYVSVALSRIILGPS